MFATRRILIGLALVAVALPGLAQTTRLRGKIESVDQGRLLVRLTDGTQAKLALAQNATVIAVVKASVSDVKPGTFIASAALPQADGTQRALEFRIFPEEMRGLGEGHRPYAPVPQGTMTNGTTFESPATGVAGSTVTVRYRDGEQKIVIPPDVQVMRYLIGTAADLKAGSHFSVGGATTKPDGVFETSRIAVGRDGIEPL